MESKIKELGTETLEDFLNDFYLIADKYRKIADVIGYRNKINFKKSDGKMRVYVEVD